MITITKPSHSPRTQPSPLLVNKLALYIFKGPLGNDTRASRHTGLFLIDENNEGLEGVLLHATVSQCTWIVDKIEEYDPLTSLNTISVPVCEGSESLDVLSSILHGVPVSQRKGYNSQLWVEDALKTLVQKGYLAAQRRSEILSMADHILQGEDDTV